MKHPILVLQYPDSREGRLVALAATRSHSALYAFKQAVLEDARLDAIGLGCDEVLLTHEQAELERLSKLLELLIPENGNG
jgi:hypothetical protein